MPFTITEVKRELISSECRRLKHNYKHIRSIRYNMIVKKKQRNKKDNWNNKTDNKLNLKKNKGINDKFIQLFIKSYI